MTRPLATAILKSVSFAEPTIDRENGIIRGVKLMELGKLARFAGEDGKPKQVTITAKHIDALLAHAGNRSLPCHDTHEWFDAQGGPNADSVEKNARIGALKNFRKDDDGNLIADCHLNLAKDAARDFLWGAANNPEDNCFSVVFSYLKDDPECIPQNFRAGDLVPQGAATTALFSEMPAQYEEIRDKFIKEGIGENEAKTRAAKIYNSQNPGNPLSSANMSEQPTKKPMDINELIAALADPKVQEAVKAIIKSHNADAEPDGDEVAKMEDEAAATMEKDAGVTDADKKSEDDQKPALMRAAIRCERARNRKFEAEKTALLSEVETKAKVAATALLGKGTFVTATDATPENDPEKFIAARLSSKASPNRAHAIAIMAKNRSDLYAVHLNK